jgi:hypothetical protein
LSFFKAEIPHDTVRYVAQRLSPLVRTKLDELLETTSDPDNLEEQEETKNTANHNTPSSLAVLKSDPGRIGLDSLISEADKLKRLRQLELPDNLFPGISHKVLQIYKERVAVEL